MARILVGSTTGLRVFATDGAEAGDRRFDGRTVTAIARERSELWAIVDGREVWHTAASEWWFHVGDVDGLRARCIADTRAGVVVGASEARLFRVAGEGLERVDAFDRVDGRGRWYTPWGGPPDTRSISEDDPAVYVNVHVGGILRSIDGGRTWEPTIDIDADVHKVWAGRGRVLAATARGLAISTDRGDSWTIEDEGLHSTYCRGVTVCADSILLSASAGPRGGDARLYRRPFDSGRLEPCRNGLPASFDGNIDSAFLDAIPELAAFGTEDGRVFASVDQGTTWRLLVNGLDGMRCVLVVP